MSGGTVPQCSPSDAATTLPDVAQQRKLGSIGGVVTEDDELEQTLCLMVGVRRGSVPLSPTRGSLLFELIDEPIDVVRAKAPLLAQQAVAADPRIELLAVSVVRQGESWIELELDWRRAGAAQSKTTTVRVQ